MNKVLGVYTDWNRPGAKGKYGGVGWYRVINPLEKLGLNVVSGEGLELGGKDRVKNAIRLKQMGDIWFCKYVDDMSTVLHLLTARDVMKTKLVIDLDDDMFNVHELNYAYKYHYPDSPKQKTLKYLINEADAITVSTEPLRASMKQYNKNVEVLPNAIDTSIWGKNKRHRGKLRIGWILSANHEQDISEVIEPLLEILKKYDVEFYHIGWDSDYFNMLPKKSHKFVMGTSGYKEFPKFMSKLGLDIAIAPLIKDKFNEAKSNIKWLEASMLEIPMVASNVYPYEHSIKDGKTGFLAGSHNQWVNKLSKLIESKELREKIGKNAKKEAMKNYNVDNVLPMYNNFFKKL